MHAAAARWPHIGDARREGAEGVQALAPFVERQRLEVELEIGRRVFRAGARERPELRRRHGQRPGAQEEVFEAHGGPFPEPRIVGVERPDAADLVDRPELEAVLEILADAGQVPDRPDAEAGEPLGVADARQLEDLRRADGAGGKDHLAGGAGEMALAVAPEQDAGRAPALENRALDLDAGLEPEIGPVQHRLEEAPRRAPAPAALLVDLEVGRALVVAGVEVFDRRDAGRRRRRADGVEDLPADARMTRHSPPRRWKRFGGAMW